MIYLLPNRPGRRWNFAARKISFISSHDPTLQLYFDALSSFIVVHPFGVTRQLEKVK
jgi:hypothetical protein